MTDAELAEFMSTEFGLYRNEHGVWGHDLIGAHKRGPLGVLFVPLCCLWCSHYELAERGDYGEILSGPYCLKNIWWPTRAGACRACSNEWGRKSDPAYQLSCISERYHGVSAEGREERESEHAD